MAWPLFLAIVIACYFILDKFLNVSHVAKEPPLIPQPLPFIRHLLGILRHGSSYYFKISSVAPHFHTKKEVNVLDLTHV
jgi:hypothetical protein